MTVKTIDIEFHQIELKYTALSILESKEQAKLMASLAAGGQHSPVLAVPFAVDDRYVLIDGYRRADALKRLGRDTIQALIAPMSETEALLMKHRLEIQRRRSALEEAWLLKELTESHSLSQEELAVRLDRSRSWVCRRLALVAVLPEKVQEQVRRGRISPQAAMKYLVPLARANPEDCGRLVENLGGAHLSVRQMGKLYTAWRTGDTRQRERIIEKPLICLKADEEVLRPDPPFENREDKARALLRDLDIIGSVCRRARFPAREGVQTVNNLAVQIQRAWLEACLAFKTLGSLLREDGDDNVGQSETGSDPGTEEAGTRDQDHRPGHEYIAQHGQKGVAEREHGASQNREAGVA